FDAIISSAVEVHFECAICRNVFQSRHLIGHQQSRRYFPNDRIRQRDLPEQWLGVLEIHSEALLSKPNLAVGLSLNDHDRKSGLLRPAGRNFTYGIVRSIRERAPQIRSGCVRILMGGHVLLDSIAENVLTEKTLQHSQK